MGGNPNQQQGPLQNPGQTAVPSQLSGPMATGGVTSGTTSPLGGPFSNLAGGGSNPLTNFLGGILGNLSLKGGFMSNDPQQQQPGAANPNSPAITQPTFQPNMGMGSGMALFSPQQQFAMANSGNNPLMGNFGTLLNPPGTPTAPGFSGPIR
jgi:hypothetical protein